MDGKILKSRDTRTAGKKLCIPTAENDDSEIRGHRGKREEKDGGPAGEPELDLIKNEEGVVTHMHVKCPCGRELMVECDYFSEE